MAFVVWAEIEEPQLTGRATVAFPALLNTTQVQQSVHSWEQTADRSSPHLLHRPPGLALTPLHAFSIIVGLGIKQKPSVRRRLPCMHAHTLTHTHTHACSHERASERTMGRPAGP